MDFAGLFVPLIGAVLVLLLLARLIAGKADEGRDASKTDGGRLEFAPNRRSFWAVYLLVACLSYVVVASLVHGIRTGADLAVPGFCIGFAVLLLMAFPATIVADDKGLEQVYWLRGRKRIAWTEVAKVAVKEKGGEVKIRSKSGVKILHTRQLPDRKRLLAELDQRCTDTVSAAPPAKVPAMSGPA